MDRLSCHHSKNHLPAMNKRLIQSLLVLSLLGFFSASSAEPPPPPSIDLSTPEKALRSYWALRGWEGEVFNEKMKLHSAGFVDTLPHIQKITTGTANQFFSTLRNSPRDGTSPRFLPMPSLPKHSYREGKEGRSSSTFWLPKEKTGSLLKHGCMVTP